MVRKTLLRASAALLFSMICGVTAFADVKGYYQWPEIHGDLLVFASEEDLWRAPKTGGRAARLTSHAEAEYRPSISPDGQWLAFNARYDGATDVYVMPTSGGAPRQLTFEGNGTRVRGWSPDGRVLYTSTNAPGTRTRLLRLVDPESLAVETLPLMDANQGVFSADGRTLFFTRFGLSLSNDNALLYRGGRMAQLWRFDLESDDEAIRLAADFGAPIRHPMWWQARVYFVSDKSGADNIWSIDESGGDLRQHTEFSGWQLRDPRLADGEIVYQRGADLFRYDIRGGEESAIPLTLISDRDHKRIRWIEEPLDYLDSSLMGAQGESVALTARGRVAVAFPGERRRVELAIPEGARARAAVVGAEGDWIYLLLDQGLSGAIVRFPVDGRGLHETLLNSPGARIWGLYPSPDGRRLLFDDMAGKLWSFDIDSRQATDLETTESDYDRPFEGFAWSTGGRFVAYSAIDDRHVSRLIIRDLETGRREVLTTTKYRADSPAFSADDRWLYFLSDRNFEPSPSRPWGDRNMGPAFKQRGMIFALQLDPDAPFPFKADHELNAAADKAADEGDDGEEADREEKAESHEEAVVLDGLADRLWKVPVDPGDYRALATNKNFLYLLDRSNGSSELLSITIDPLGPDIETFAEDIEDFALSLDGKTLFYRAESGDDVVLALVPAEGKSQEDLSDFELRIDDWRLGIDPPSEWQQMLLDAWRLHRDFAFDSDLRGVVWESVLEKYRPLLERVGHRSEVDDVLEQMVAELGILHSNVKPGDVPKDEESGDASFLGAEYAPEADGLEITMIYDGERELPDQLGPLLQPDVDVRPGDLLTGVDGRPVNSRSDLTAALQHKAGQQVRLDYLRGRETLSAIVSPVDRRGYRRLLYRHWVQKTREKVFDASDGKIGYLHLWAMQGPDIASFARDFYEHFDKDALIIDVRGNRGGNIDSWIIGTLLRRVWAFWISPLNGPATPNMQQTFRGHLAVLINEGTYSDGETFAAGIKALCIAPLIGTQTAGAGIWLWPRNQLSDGGVARVGDWPQYALDGSWLIEARGVSPDFEPVVNAPHATFNGADAQLEAAIDYLKDKMVTEPIPDLAAKPLPGLGGYGEDVQERLPWPPTSCPEAASQRQ